jgi:MFS family permease
MYQVESSYTVITERRTLTSRATWLGTGRTVLFLGLTSLFTDVSAEMVASTLPLFLLITLRLSPFEYGVIDGLYQGGAALVRVISGFVVDRWQQHKQVAFVGYALSALSKLGLLLAGFGGWPVVTAMIFVDRIGKGIRTAPRDALIAATTSRENLATAFGVHRALDTAGAMLGPMLAFAILWLAPQRFDSVFVVSLCFAVIGLVVLSHFVEGRTAERPRVTTLPVHVIRQIARIPGFRVLLVAAGLLAVFSLSDAMLYIGLQRRLGFDAVFLPLLFVATALVFMLLAVPMGLLADHLGRRGVFFAGYLLLVLAYAAFAWLPALGGVELAVFVLLLGAHYAATDGVLAALASGLLPPNVRTSGLATLATFTSLARLLSSMLFGWLWSVSGQLSAVALFTVALFASLALAWWMFARLGSQALAPISGDENAEVDFNGFDD